MLTRRLYILNKRREYRSLLDTLTVADHTMGVPRHGMLQVRSLTKTVPQLLHCTSESARSRTDHRYVVYPHNTQPSGLVSAGQLHLCHHGNSIQQARLYRTAPQQKDGERSDSKVRKDTAVRDVNEESETIKKLNVVGENGTSGQKETTDSDTPSSAPGIFERFKNAYKEYGKALVAVHAATSSVWFGSFYYTASSGVNVAGILGKIGASESIIDQLQSTGLGYAAVAYLMYKLATPARYTVTILGTQFTVKYLRRHGYMKPVPEGDSLKELWKDGRKEVKSRYEEKKEEMKDRMKERVDDLRDEVKDKAEELRGEVKERLKDKAADLKGEPKGKWSGKKNEE